MIWRYDPIVLSEITPPEYHRAAYARLAHSLAGFTERSVISLMDDYPKIRARMQDMARQGARLLPVSVDKSEGQGSLPGWPGKLLRDLAAIAQSNQMEIVSCAEEIDLRPFGIRPGKCIDDEIIERIFGLEVSHTKDPGQRNACGCVVSKDIGMYDSCLFGCQYCYATTSFARARANYLRHDPEASSMYS